MCTLVYVIIYAVVMHFVICNLLIQNSGSRVSVSVSVPESRKRSWWGTWETPATFGFGAGRLSFRPAPPPNVALSEPLPGGLQGWLRAVSDMRTCGPARQRGARRRSSHPSQERKRGPRMVATGQADQDRDWCNDAMEKQ